MALYNEERIIDTKDITRYERAYRVQIHNPLNKAPTLTFLTSWVERDNDTGVEMQQEFARTLNEDYNANKVFNMRDTDGNIVGQMSHAQLFAALYGMFFDVAGDTDSEIL